MLTFKVTLNLLFININFLKLFEEKIEDLKINLEKKIKKISKKVFFEIHLLQIDYKYFRSQYFLNTFCMMMIYFY